MTEFDWDVESFEGNKLKLKILFNQPLFFSQGAIKDQIEIQIFDISYFKAVNASKSILL